MVVFPPKPRPICRNRTVYRINPYGQPQARLTYQKDPKIKESPFHDVHKLGSIVRESLNIKDHSWSPSPLGQTWSKEMLPFPARKLIAAHASARLSNPKRFSFPIRKKCLTPSHLKLLDLTPSRIISPRLISSPLFIFSPGLTSPHVISPYLTSPYLTSWHLIPPRLIWKLALKSIITSTNNMVFKKANLAHRKPDERTGLSTKRSTKHVGPCTIIQVSIFMDQPVFAKTSHPYLHILISAGCMQTVIRILGIKRTPFKSNHGTTKWNESTPGHCMRLHHVIV